MGLMMAPCHCRNDKQMGFTLIEVLLALAIIAIALTALLKTTATNIADTQRVKQKMVSHWVAMQGITMIQSGLLPMITNRQVSQVTTLLGQKWYWRAIVTPSLIPNVQQISIVVSARNTGPFGSQHIGFRYAP